MATLVDTSVWIDFTRSRSPEKLKAFIAPFILRPGVHAAAPIEFEILRRVTVPELRQLESFLATFPLLESPPDLWKRAAVLGRETHAKGVNATSMDLLIATIAICHDAELLTFDAGFRLIADCAPLRANVLVRPAVG